MVLPGAGICGGVKVIWTSLEDPSLPPVSSGGLRLLTSMAMAILMIKVMLSIISNAFNNKEVNKLE